MIDVKQIRADPEALREAIRRRKVDPHLADVDRWLELDGQRRKLQIEVDGVNGEKKKLARLGKTDPEAARAQGQELREQGRKLEEEVAASGAEWQRIMDWFPNWPHPDMPEGAGEEENVEERAWIPGEGYLAADKLGRGETSGASMPRRPVHAEDGEFEP